MQDYSPPFDIWWIEDREDNRNLTASVLDVLVALQQGPDRTNSDVPMSTHSPITKRTQVAHLDHCFGHTLHRGSHRRAGRGSYHVLACRPRLFTFPEVATQNSKRALVR